MTTKSEFPVYGNFKAAQSQGCFVCLSPMENAKIMDGQYAPGRGKWKMHCAECGCWTWFDIHENA